MSGLPWREVNAWNEVRGRRIIALGDWVPALGRAREWGRGGGGGHHMKLPKFKPHESLSLVKWKESINIEVL